MFPIMQFRRRGQSSLWWEFVGITVRNLELTQDTVDTCDYGQRDVSIF